MSDLNASLKPGDLVAGTWEVSRLLGRGGMGEVWLAENQRLKGKQVAIKVLHTGQGGLSADALARFKREAEIASKLGHPHIVDVHDFNTLASGAPYVVMEYLKGESLASRLRYGPVSEPDARRIVRHVGSALAAAHAHGIVHRDLKPENILLMNSPMGEVAKLLDFGISKVADSTTLKTQEQVLVGTPQYMSPEQALGHNKDVGPLADIWALGTIAYEMLSGRPPFQGESIAQVVFRVAYEPHPPLLQLAPKVTPSMAEAVERALQKDKSRRQPTVGEFVEQFTGEPLPAFVPAFEAPSGAVSGVATPSMAAKLGSGLEKTSAPTPRTPHPSAPQPIAPLATGHLLGAVASSSSAAPAAVYASASASVPAAAKKSGVKWVVVLSSALAAMLCVGVGLSLMREGSALSPAPSSEPPLAPSPGAVGGLRGGGAANSPAEPPGEPAPPALPTPAPEPELPAAPPAPKPPPGPSPRAALTPEEVESLKPLGKMLSDGKFDDARREAQRLLRNEPSRAMEGQLFEALALISCHLRELANFHAVIDDVPFSRRAAVKAQCRQMGFAVE